MDKSTAVQMTTAEAGSITVDRFGRDHWSTLLYVETRNVDANGSIEARKLRSKLREGWLPKFGTILRDGNILTDHDDHNCLIDLIEADLLRRDGFVFTLTDLGWTVAAALRRNRANGLSDAEFDVQPFLAESKLAAKLNASKSMSGDDGWFFIRRTKEGDGFILETHNDTHIVDVESADKLARVMLLLAPLDSWIAD
jgi:hypothetical protein